MPRKAREVILGWPHHVTQRGNYRQIVFSVEDHRQMYMQLAIKYFRQYHLRQIGYCLMNNHVHLIPIPESDKALSKGVGRLDADYSRWHNLQCERSGHLWQARFYSCPVDPESAWDVLAYVELNPVRAGLVEKPEDWPWSSARAHRTGMDPTGMLDFDGWERVFTHRSWADFLWERHRDPDRMEAIRSATRSGRPIARTETLRHLSLSRAPAPRRPGRPPQP